MFRKLVNHFRRKALKDETFAFLFDEPKAGEYIALDFETTSLDPKQAEIVSIGAVRVQDNRLLTSQKFSMLVKPENAMERESITVHHLRHTDLEQGEKPEEALKALLFFIGARPIVGYYIEFDVAILNRYTKQLIGCRLPNRTIEVSGLYYDKKEKLIPQGHIDLRFDTILNDLDIPSFGKHNALGDAIMAAMVFLKLKRSS